MTKIEPNEYNTAQLYNIEKINGDYFLKVIPSNADGNTQYLKVSDYTKLLSKRTDLTDGTVIYIGWAVPGASESSSIWRITKIVISGENISNLWADSNTDFDNSWTNRASLTYA